MWTRKIAERTPIMRLATQVNKLGRFDICCLRLPASSSNLGAAVTDEQGGKGAINLWLKADRENNGGKQWVDVVYKVVFW